MISIPKILTVGSANIDLNARTYRVPARGETVLEENRYEYLPGGKGANSAKAFAVLGGESVFAAKLGSDTHGAKLSEIYRSFGIDTRFVTCDKKERTGLAIVLTEASGDNRIIVYPGANNRLRGVDAEEAMTCYPDALYMQLEIPDETVIAAAEFARAAGAKIFIDAGPARRDFPLERLGLIEVFSPNEEETFTFTGIRPTTVEACLKACLALSARVDTKYIVLKLGGRGVYLYDGKYFNIISPYNVEVVDSTAAGDAFTAAMTLEYLRCDDMVRACRFGCVVGALTVSKPGSFTAIPSRNEVEKFMSVNDIRLD